MGLKDSVQENSQQAEYEGMIMARKTSYMIASDASKCAKLGGD